MRPRLALAAAVLLAFVAYGSLATLATTPRIFYDELLYMEAADSLASGEGLSVRGEPYERGVVYPALLAPLLVAAPDREIGYALAKLLNALLFALAAIPVYLLARRLLEPWPSVGVAALAVTVPSSVYVSVVMTEAVAYLAACWTLLAIAAAVERPTVARQSAALVAIAAAFLTRAQFAALYPAFLLALGLALWLLPERRTRLRASVVRLWPAIVSLLAAAAVLAVPVVRGDSPFESLGEYETAVRAPDPLEVGKWLAYHLAGLDLYLGVVAVALAPIVLVSWARRARDGSEAHASLLATFVAASGALLAVTATVVGDYERSGLGIDRLHDRYLFYVLPLWLLVLVAWLADGAPKPRRAAAWGVAAALALTLVLPWGELELEDGVKLFSAVGTALPAAFVELAGSAAAASVVVLVLAALLLAAVLRRPGRGAGVAVAAVVAVFVLDAILVWGRAFNPPEEAVFAGGLERRWVDEAVAGRSSVAVLATPCEDGVLARDSLFLTEFFNAAIGPAVAIGGDFPTGSVGPGGGVEDDSGRPLDARYVVAQQGVQVAGRPIHEGTNARLVLWETDGRVAVRDAASSDDVTRAACN